MISEIGFIYTYISRSGRRECRTMLTLARRSHRWGV